MKTLDKNKPFGEIFGFPGPACYEQDGVLFRSDGTEFSVNPVDAGPVDVSYTPVEIEQVETETDVDEKIFSMWKDGRNLSEISRATGMHHLKVKRIIKEKSA